MSNSITSSMIFQLKVWYSVILKELQIPVCANWKPMN